MSDYQTPLRAKPWTWVLFFEILLFLCIVVFGIYAAMMSGISADEETEFNTFLVNLAAYKGLLAGDFSPYQTLLQYHDRYYGIGFHLISHGLGNFLTQFNLPVLQLNEIGSRLIWAHAINFLAFIVSGIVFRQCLLVLTGHKLVSNLGMFVFLLWPYLLGHALMNVKDIPFLLAWLCCSYQLLRMLTIFQDASRNWITQFVILGLLTGWLISIRVSGVLIFAQYFCFSLIYIGYSWNRGDARFSIQKSIYLGFAFAAPALLILFFLYPILWHDPFEIINAIAYMSKHPWLGSTLTAGELIEPKTRLIFYLFSWIIVKLPVLMVLGICLTPIAIYKVVSTRKISLQQLMTVCLALSIASILGILILKRVALYNELRQILFIFPVLLLVSIVALFSISQRLTILGLLLTGAFMVVDDIDLMPYQYSYVNEIARQTQLGKKYETDYFGLSVAQTARWLNQSDINGSTQCIYVPSPQQWKYEIDPIKFPCVQAYPGDLSLIKEPFMFFVQPKGNVSYSAPPWCHLAHVEQRLLSFSKATLNMGELYQCNQK